MSAYVTEGKRKRIYARDNFTCRYCGKKLAKGELSVDHVIPKSRGGDNNENNLVTACAQCQWEKGSKLLSECGMKLTEI